jgi:hypothetical protein
MEERTCDECFVQFRPVTLQPLVSKDVVVLLPRALLVFLLPHTVEEVLMVFLPCTF